ncbi:MAG: YjgN family protein [Acinetobacter sp.]|nr:YjgN family protein [Acinetobacter sp.]
MQHDTQPAINTLETPPPIPTTPTLQPLKFNFSFHGSASEYFKIWLSNLFLTIITLSLYAPWAKVRRLRYFYGNTSLNQKHFDFTALPKRILVGRIIAIIFFLAFSISSEIAPEWALALLILAIIFTPWLIRSTFRFHARNSKYANSRLQFTATMSTSYGMLLGCVLMTVFSFGLLYPLAVSAYKSYQINHLKIAQLPFKLNAPVSGYFAAILLPYILTGLIFAVAIIIVTIIDTPEAFMLILTPIYLGAIFFIGPWIQGKLFKLIWNNVQIGSTMYFQCDIKPIKFAWISASNYIVMLLSLGLLTPWAKIRLYRYKVESLSLHSTTSLQMLDFIPQQDENSIAEELADVFDLDLSL